MMMMMMMFSCHKETYDWTCGRILFVIMFHLVIGEPEPEPEDIENLRNSKLLPGI